MKKVEPKARIRNGKYMLIDPQIHIWRKRMKLLSRKTDKSKRLGSVQDSAPEPTFFDKIELID